MIASIQLKKSTETKNKTWKMRFYAEPQCNNIYLYVGREKEREEGMSNILPTSIVSVKRLNAITTSYQYNSIKKHYNLIKVGFTARMLN